MSKLEDILECCVCNNKWNETTNIPNLLNCGNSHVLCSSCCRGQYKAESKKMQCPICRIEFQCTLQDLPVVRQLIEIATINVEEEKLDLGNLKKCKKHNSDVIVYCNTDQEFICHECLKLCVDHSIQGLENKIKDIKKEFDEVSLTVGNLQQKQRIDISRFKQTDFSIDQQFKDLEDKIRQKAQAMCQIIIDQAQQKINKLQLDKQGVRPLKNQIQELEGICNKIQNLQKPQKNQVPEIIQYLNDFNRIQEERSSYVKDIKLTLMLKNDNYYEVMSKIPDYLDYDFQYQEIIEEQKPSVKIQRREESKQQIVQTTQGKGPKQEINQDQQGQLQIIINRVPINRPYLHPLNQTFIISRGNNKFQFIAGRESPNSNSLDIKFHKDDQQVSPKQFTIWIYNKDFYLQDNASIQGTLLKLDKEKPFQLQSNLLIIFGEFMYVCEILKCENGSGKQPPLNSYKHIIAEDFWQNSWQNVEKSYERLNSQKEQNSQENLKYAEVKLKINPCRDFPEGKEFELKSSFDQRNVFVLGRNGGSTVLLSERNISGEQARIVYEPKHGWLIFDGSLQKNSANGTFVMLQSKQLKQMWQESNPIKIWDGMIFGVSGTHFICKLT